LAAFSARARLLVRPFQRVFVGVEEVEV